MSARKKIQLPIPAKSASPINLQRSWWEVLIILLLVFATYGNSIRNEYNLDDGYVVSLDEGNPLTKKGISGIPELLTTNYSNGPGVTYGYRPLGKITLAIEYSLWGNNPHYSHFINVLLFALNVFLLLLFLKKTASLFGYKNEAVLYGAVLLFIIHPIHTEVVCSIKNREEILCFTFAIAALFNTLKLLETQNWRYLFLIAGFMLLANLAKETAFMVIPVSFILLLFYRIMNLQGDVFSKDAIQKIFFQKSGLWLLIGIAIPFFTFIWMSTSVLRSDIGYKFETTPTAFYAAGHNIPNGMQTIFFYISKLLIPFPLRYYYGYDMLPDRGWDSFYPYAGLLLISVVLAVIVFNIHKRKNLYFSLWLMVFGINIAFFSNIKPAPSITGIVGERLIYQASAGFCVLLAIGLYQLAVLLKKYFFTQRDLTPVKLTGLLLIPLFVPYGLMTLNRNTQWYDKTTLFEHDITYLTKSARANFMMGSHIMKELGKEGEIIPDKKAEIYRAKSYFEKAVAVYPKCNDAWIALGKVYRSYLNNTDSALACWGRVDTLQKFTYINAQELMGNIYYFDKPDNEKALQYFYPAFYKYTLNEILYGKIIDILLQTHRYDAIIPLADIAIRNHWIDGFVNKGDAYLNMKDTVLAVRNYEIALSKGFKSDVLISNLEYYYKLHGKMNELPNKLPN
ncbi:MAG: hypothetical protein IPM95_08135 [Sphingobacteriales bacterium]|nr:hypothetical protein [Sphingobacteriales bacterium]